MRAAIGACLVLCVAAPAAAQDQAFGESHFVGDTPVDVAVRWSGRAGQPRGRVDVRVGERVRTLHDGAPAYAWAEGGARGVLVAMIGASSTVEARFVPVADGRPGAVRAHALRRTAGADRSPIGAAVAATPDGFSLFWQEASTSNAQALYETYLARFDHGGRPVGETTRVNADWPIADVAWMPSRGQYYFLLYYGGGDPRGTRLCGVHVDPDRLVNVEHPWWASAPGMIDEARLVVRGDRIVALYRDEEHLYEIDVTEGSWGRGPTASRRDHGAIRSDTAFGARATADGIALRRVPLSGS